jgi:hypothetical protein
MLAAWRGSIGVTSYCLPARWRSLSARFTSFCSRHREHAQQLGAGLPYERVARTARTTSGPSSLESKAISDAMPRTVAVAIWMIII